MLSKCFQAESGCAFKCGSVLKVLSKCFEAKSGCAFKSGGSEKCFQNASELNPGVLSRIRVLKVLSKRAFKSAFKNPGVFSAKSGCFQKCFQTCFQESGCSFKFGSQIRVLSKCFQSAFKNPGVLSNVT